MARIDQIPRLRGLSVELGPCTIALFNVQGCIFAVDGSCVRCAALLASATLEGREAACSGCGWRYDLTSGRVTGIPKLRIDTFEVQVVGDRVFVVNPFA